MSSYYFDKERQAARERFARSDPSNPMGGPLNEQTGLPEYPRGTHAHEERLRKASEGHASVAARLATTLEEIADVFAETFEVEDRRAATMARISAAAKRTNNR